MSSRSSVYRWMTQNYDGFSAILAEAGRPDWAAIAAAFAEDGLTVADKKPPTKEAVRQTWIRVQAARKAADARRQAAATPVAQPTAHKVAASRPAAAGDGADKPTTSPDNPRGFRPGKLRGT